MNELWKSFTDDPERLTDFIEYTARQTGFRPELVEKETKEMQILKKYLPEQLSEAEIARVVQRIIGETGAGGMQDIGKVMKAAMGEFKGRADGKLVSQVVAGKLKPQQDKEKP